MTVTPDSEGDLIGWTNAGFALLKTILGQPLPAELSAAPPREILPWAIGDWRLSRLWQAGPITVEPETFAA